METIVFVCENSIEGILTGVYNAWAEALSSGLGHTHCRLAVTERLALCRDRENGQEFLGGGREEHTGDGEGICEPGYFNMELFCTYRETKTDMEKAGKVIRTLRKRLGEEVYECLCYAMASREPDKAEAVYKRNVGCEIHRELEFLRFQELENGILLARIHPKNDILMYLGPHFSDRLPLENFLIYDMSRRKALFHERNKTWYLMNTLELDDQAGSRISTQEEYYQDLFRMFCRTISIQSRENRALQRQFLPYISGMSCPSFQKTEEESTGLPFDTRSESSTGRTEGSNADFVVKYADFIKQCTNFALSYRMNM